MANIRHILLCFIYLSECLLCSSLICPMYSSRHRLIRHCQSNCSFQLIEDDRDACLGIYYNHSGEIFIKQLGIIHRDERCSQSEQCILDLDQLNPQMFTCCCTTDNCTLTWTSLSPSTTSTTRNPLKIIHFEENSFSWQLFVIIILCLFSVILLIVLFIWCQPLHHQREKNVSRSLRKSLSVENLFFSAQQLVLGKNSIIYKGIFHHDIIALKVYQNTHVSIWTNEMILLKSIEHDSIIKILSDGQYETHWYLVLPFYENGTLQSYLRTSHRTLTIDQCLTFVRSLASAIAYLHLGQNTTGMTIVHRDIKSSNILVSNNGLKVCLTDFGMAAALPRILKEKDFIQLGTMRYMAPELLEGVIAHTREALCSVDMYALALVMWEIVSQCDVFVNTGYRAPYDEYLTNAMDRASFSVQLYDIVVTRRLRPTLVRPVKDLQYASIIQEISTLIEACWMADPDLRQNAPSLTLKLNQIHF